VNTRLVNFFGEMPDKRDKISEYKNGTLRVPRVSEAATIASNSDDIVLALALRDPKNLRSIIVLGGLTGLGGFAKVFGFVLPETKAVGMANPILTLFIVVAIVGVF